MDYDEEVLKKFSAVNPVRIAGNINSIANAIDNIRRLKNFLEGNNQIDKNDTDENQKIDKNLENINAPKSEKKIQVDFSGQHTDISYASLFDDGLPTEYILKIDDDILKRNVKESFSDAVDDGYLKLDDGKYQLTDKGKEHINSPAFIKQFENDQKYSLLELESKAAFKLKGEPQDVEVFRYADSINIGAKNLYGDENTAKDVTAYFKKLERNGFVIIDKNDNITPTEKTQQFLNEHYPKKTDIELITADNVEDLAKTGEKQNSAANGIKFAEKGENPVKNNSANFSPAMAKNNVSKDVVKKTTEAGNAAGVEKAASGVGGTVTIVITVANAALKKLKQQQNDQKVSHTNSHQR